MAANQEVSMQFANQFFPLICQTFLPDWKLPVCLFCTSSSIFCPSGGFGPVFLLKIDFFFFLLFLFFFLCCKAPVGLYERLPVLVEVSVVL